MTTLARLRLAISITLLALLGTATSHAKVQPTNPEEVKTVVDANKDSLTKTALAIFDALVANDSKTLLKYVDPKGGIEFGADGSLTYNEVQDQFAKHSGQLYCFLFDCPKYDFHPVREAFRITPRDKISITIQARPEQSAKDFYIAHVIYEWPGKAEVRDFNDPDFKFGRDKKWYLEKPFTE